MINNNNENVSERASGEVGRLSPNLDYTHTYRNTEGVQPNVELPFAKVALVDPGNVRQERQGRYEIAPKEKGSQLTAVASARLYPAHPWIPTMLSGTTSTRSGSTTTAAAAVQGKVVRFGVDAQGHVHEKERQADAKDGIHRGVTSGRDKKFAKGFAKEENGGQDNHDGLPAATVENVQKQDVAFVWDRQASPERRRRCCCWWWWSALFSGWILRAKASIAV